MTLFEIDGGISELLENGFNAACVDLETGEIDEAKAAAYLEGLQIDRAEKLDNYGKYIKNLTAEAAALKEQEKTFAERRKAKEKKIECLKNAVLCSMLNKDEKKFETVNVVYSLRKSESVEVTNFDELPVEYKREKVTVEPAKDELKKALKNGETINGAVLVEKQNLQIK